MCFVIYLFFSFRDKWLNCDKYIMDNFIEVCFSLIYFMLIYFVLFFLLFWLIFYGKGYEKFVFWWVVLIINFKNVFLENDFCLEDLVYFIYIKIIVY